MTISLSFYWWMLPLAITVISFIPAAMYKPRDYDPGGAILGLIGIVATVVSWAVAIVMRLAA